MSLYSESIDEPRRRSAQYYQYPARRGVDLATSPRVEVYDKPISLPRHYPDSDWEEKGALVVRSKPLRVRAASSDDDDERRSRRKSVVLRPRSASRVRIQEPVLLVDTSSSDEEPRRSWKNRGDDTRIRATSRPGKKNEYAFVRRRGKSDAKAAVVTDLELKTDRRHKDFQSRRNDLENTEALVLVRARSQERDRLVDDLSDLDSYDGRRQRSHYNTENRRNRASLDSGRRAIIIAQDDRDRDDRRRSTRGPKLYKYGDGLVIAGDGDDIRSKGRGSGRRRISLSPDRETIDSSTVDGSLMRASTVSSRDPRARRSRAYDDRVADPDTRLDPRRDSAYFTDSERRAREREREAIEREKRAIEREKAALDREKLLADREKRIPARDFLDDRGRDAGDYLRQGQTLLKDGQKYYKDGQKYYKGGQAVMGGIKNLLK
ncbi:hypothetical protein GJ744_004769 [Endocarpon pusillum]|uniref:Uncharacterized protein n=1 Tax=Endocarpon pusillum TaxID=364733 RepID=A0A8H7ACX3_9EURO|nr:hypothetical protein GJ744_004769 [Endocarpon pusillum]